MDTDNKIMQEYWEKLSSEIKPALHFEGSTQEDYTKWRNQFQKKFKELLGPIPDKVDLDPVTVSTEDCGTYIREKVIFNSEQNAKIPAWVLIPKEKKGERLPAIICCHGHGWNAKDNVCGIDENDPDRKNNIEESRYEYAVDFVNRGYITIAIDSRGWNERGDGSNTPFGAKDKCNVNGLKASILGYQLITLDIFDHQRTLDYLETRDDVDSERFGIIGLSFGGTMSLWTAAVDNRIKATCVSGYLCTWDSFAIRKNKFCGSQTLHGIARWGAMSDVAGLIAPRAILVESGTRDQIFPIESVHKAFEHLKSIYTATGNSDYCEHDVFEGGHRYNGEKSPAFFEKYL